MQVRVLPPPEKRKNGWATGIDALQG